MLRFYRTSILLSAASLAVLASCGRNPGPVVRNYPFPGAAQVEKQIALAKTKCMDFNPKDLGAQTESTGKEKFKPEAPGRFTLENYEVTGIVDQVDRTVPNYSLKVTSFHSLDGKAPALVIDAECLDTKEIEQKLSFSPVTEIDSKTGLVLSAQPFTVGIAQNGALTASSLKSESAPQPVPAKDAPEAALLLGQAYMKSLKTMHFNVASAADGGLEIEAQFVGFDQNLSRQVYRVHAVYSWESTP